MPIPAALSETGFLSSTFIAMNSRQELEILPAGLFGPVFLCRQKNKSWQVGKTKHMHKNWKMHYKNGITKLKIVEIIVDYHRKSDIILAVGSGDYCGILLITANLLD